MAQQEDLPSDDAALESLLRDRRLGPTDPDDVTPWDFVFRWPDESVRQRVWPIVSRMLLDPDELIRERAVEFVRGWRKGVDVAIPRLLDVVEQHIDLFSQAVVEGIPIRETVAHALSNRARADSKRVVAQLRRLAADAPLGGGAAAVLGEYDPEFATQQAARWGDAAIDWIDEAARSLALFRRDEVLPFLQALRGLSDGSRERIVRVVGEYIKRDDAAAASLARGDGLSPPAKRAPSPDDCRRAIGLG